MIKENAVNNDTLINIPPIISVNQCTPDISLPIIVTAIMAQQSAVRIFCSAFFLIYFFITIMALPIMIQTIMVCDDGKEAPGKSLPGMMTGL